MITARADILGTEGQAGDAAEMQHERWHHWPVNWTAVWVGTLTALAVALIIGLVGIAVGAHLQGPENRVVDLHKFGIGALIFSVCGAFFAFVAAGWVTVKVAGILRAETAMLHGAISWLVAVPAFLAVAALGGGSMMGGWYGGLSGTPAWATAPAAPFSAPQPLGAHATETAIRHYEAAMQEYNQRLARWVEETPRATRNSALGAVTALVLGLAGSVLGGWMASGQPMSFRSSVNGRTPARSPA